jgi:hypothetical protein
MLGFQRVYSTHALYLNSHDRQIRMAVEAVRRTFLASKDQRIAGRAGEDVGRDRSGRLAL